MFLSIISAGGDKKSNDGHEVNEGQRSLFSSPLQASKKRKIDKNNNTDENKISIRLAGDQTILPFVDRPKEVKDLILKTESGKELYQQIEKVFETYHQKEWNEIKQTLFEKDRDQLNDLDWLKALHLIIFKRSPRLWCHLSECVGAREICVEDKIDGEMECHSPDIGSDVVLSSDPNETPTLSPVFEILGEIPSSFRKPFNAIQGQDFTKQSSNKQRSSSFNLSESVKEEVERVLQKDNHSALGIRIGLPKSDWTPLSPLPPFTEPIQFKKQRRLSEMFLISPLEQSKKKDIETWIGNMPKYHSSAKSEPGNDTFQPLSPPDEGYFGNRGRLRGKTESAVGRGHDYDRQSRWQPFQLQSTLPYNKRFSMSSVPDHPNKQYKTEESYNKNLSGLLPDGRTRHPSAGGNEKAIKESLIAFRKENQLSPSTPSSVSSSENGSKGNSGASSPIGHDSLFTSTTPPPPPMDSLLISPLSDSSDRSLPQTPKDQQTSLFSFTPIIDTSTLEPLQKEEEDHQKDHHHYQTEGQQRFSLPGLQNATKTRSPSSIIFPVPPTAGVSRVDELTKMVRDASSLETANQEEKAAYTNIEETIGSKGIEQINEIIKQSGERCQTTDEELVEYLARICFGLVDMDLEVGNGGGSDGCVQEDDRIQKESIQRMPWYEKQFELVRKSSPSSPSILTKETKINHEIRVEIYYENIEGYEKRWKSFHFLLTKIWKIDQSIINVIRQRCGPVCQLNLEELQKQHHDEFSNESIPKIKTNVNVTKQQN